MSIALGDADDDELELELAQAEVDSFRREQQSTPLTDNPQNQPKRRLLIPLHLFAITATAALAQRATQGPTSLVFFLPVLQGFGLAVLGVVHARKNDSRAEGPINFLRREEGRAAWIVGGLSSLSVLGWLWTARAMSNRAWQAIEVFLLPAIIIVQLGVPSRFELHLSLNDRHPTSLDLSLIVVAFLVGFATLTLPPITAGALIALSRLPIEAMRLSLIKVQLGPGRNAGVFLSACAVASTVCSLALWVVLSIVLPSDGGSSLVSLRPHALSLSLYTFAAIATHLTLTLHLDHFASPLTSGATVLPRNLILLVGSFFGRRGVRPGGSLVQMMLALALGTVAWLCTDEDLGTRHIRDRLNALWGIDKSSGGSAGRAEAAEEDAGEHRSAIVAGGALKLIAALSFVPLVVALAKGAALAPSASWNRTLSPYAPLEDAALRWGRPVNPLDATVDLVFSYYDEDLSTFRDHLDNMRTTPFIAERQMRVIVYNKGAKTSGEISVGVGLGVADRVVALDNLGREGGTYLEHIVRNYDASLADWTFFLQPHFAWGGIAQPRLSLVSQETGFAHFGPYMKNWCGSDDRGVGDYQFVKELYGLFRGRLCPPEGVLTAWSAQFVVSRERILLNRKEKYEAVREYIEAPEGHWIHNGWGPNNSGGPSNPVFGHALERAWPLIFNCTDPKIAETCPDDVHEREACQCLDI